MKRGIKLLLWCVAWLNLALGMLGPIYAIFVESVGGDILDVSWAYFAFAATTALTIYVMGHIEDKIKKKENLITLGYIIASLGIFSYLFVHNQFTLIATQIILGLSIAILSPVFDSVYSLYTSKEKSASEWGNLEAIGYLVPAIAALIGGYIVKIFGFRVLFITMFIISLMSVIASTHLFKGKRYLNKE